MDRMKFSFDTGRIGRDLRGRVDESKYKISIANHSLTLKNTQITPFGGIKRAGYKTLRGFIKFLKSQNKILMKNNTKVKFEVVLPLPVR